MDMPDFDKEYGMNAKKPSNHAFERKQASGHPITDDEIVDLKITLNT